MTPETLAHNLRYEMFASRESVAEAMSYAYELIQTLPAADRITAFTALHVVLNAVADQIAPAVEA